MSRLDDLLDEWESRVSAGEPCAPETLCVDCPELLVELRWQIRALQAVESCFGAVGRQESNSDADSGPREVQPPEAVRVVSDYRIERLHASGGLGSVFIATDPVLGRRVAIKFPRWRSLTAEQVARFEREARITVKLDHPGVIPVHAMRTDLADQPFYVMRFVEGHTLQDLIRKLHDTWPHGRVVAGSRGRGSSVAAAARSSQLPSGPTAIAETGTAEFCSARRPDLRPRAFFESLAFRQQLQNLVTVCNIAAYAHGQGVIHRDIKPANILLGRFGEVLLLDWGLARHRDESRGDPETEPHPDPALPAGNMMDNRDRGATRAGQVLGTPAFASPEQLLGRTAEVDERSDVYSLGATLRSLLRGSNELTDAGLPEHLRQLASGSALPSAIGNPAVPAPLASITATAMAVQATQRYPTALALARDLERYLAGEQVSVHRDSAVTRLVRVVRKRPSAAAAIAASVLVATLAGGIGAAVLGRKNAELGNSNQQLALAVTEAQAATQQSLEVLRTLASDVVARKFSEQEELSADDRAFLQDVLRRYDALAKVKGDSIDSRAIRAEGLRQSGAVLIRLSEEQQSRERFEESAALYQQLLAETGREDFRIELASVLEALADSHYRFGELDDAHAATGRGIRLLEGPGGVPSANPQAQRVLAGLHRMTGEIHTEQRNSAAAVASEHRALELLEQLRSSNAASTELNLSLAATLRALAGGYENLGHTEQHEAYSRRALELFREMADGNPESRDVRLGLAWAWYDHSYAVEQLGNHTLAMEEATAAIGEARRLVTQYPLIDDFQGALGTMLTRRGGLYRVLEHPDDAVDDLEEARRLFDVLVVDTSEAARSYAQLLRTLRNLAAVQAETGAIEDAIRTSQTALVRVEEFARQYPEAAAQSVPTNELPTALAELLVRQSRMDEAMAVLTATRNRLESSRQTAVSSLQAAGRLQTGVALTQLLRQLGRAEESRQELMRTLDAAERLLPEFQKQPNAFVAFQSSLRTIVELASEDDPPGIRERAANVLANSGVEPVKSE